MNMIRFDLFTSLSAIESVTRLVNGLDTGFPTLFGYGSVL